MKPLGITLQLSGIHLVHYYFIFSAILEVTLKGLQESIYLDYHDFCIWEKEFRTHL